MGKWVVAVFLFVGVYSVSGQLPVEVDDAVDHRDFMPSDLVYFVDVTNQISFDEISSAGFQSHFRQHTSYQNSDFKENASYWVKVVLKSIPVTTVYMNWKRSPAATHLNW